MKGVWDGSSFSKAAEIIAIHSHQKGEKVGKLSKILRQAPIEIPIDLIFTHF